MGQFISNIQVSTLRSKKESISVPAAQSALDSYIQTKGYEKISDSNKSDKGIAIQMDSKKQWISIYDEELDNQSQEQMEEMCEAISKTLECIAVGSIVHDSDSLMMYLYDNGEKKSVYVSAPDSDEDTPLNMEPWFDLLADQTTSEELQQLWDTDFSFAEDLLEKTAELFGMNPDHALQSYSYLEDNEIERTNYRLVQKPSVEVDPESPTKLVRDASIPFFGGKKDDSFSVCTSFTNAGGISKGLIIIVWGKAIQDELIKITTIENKNYKRKQTKKKKLEFETCIESAMFKITNDEPTWYAKFPDFEFPNGINTEIIHKLPQTEASKATYRWLDTKIIISIHGQYLKEGKGYFHVGYAPMTNMEKGQSSDTISIYVDS